MRLTRQGMALGLAVLGVSGVLAAGAGVAQAASETSPSPSAGTWPGRGGGFGIGGGQGAMGGHRMMGGNGACLTGAASYLGLDQADLVAELRAGKTLAQVAEDRGKSEAGLKDAMVAAATKAIEANTALTAEQKKAALEQVEERVEAMIDRSHQPGAGQGRRGGGNGRGLGRLGA